MGLTHQLIILGSCYLLSAARLPDKNQEDANTTHAPDVIKFTYSQRDLRQVHRVSRDNKSDKVTPIFIYNPKTRPSAKRRILVRDPRHSAPNEENVMSNPMDEQEETNQVLVKAPIPKFYELDYENEYQKHLERISLRHVVDSGADHEDEDFNVSDYEFDVNHDEFLGQGKPIEPKVKILDNVMMSDLVRNQDAYNMQTSKVQSVRQQEAAVEVKPLVRGHLVGTYKPGQQIDEENEIDTKSTPIQIDDENHGATGEYDKAVNHGKFTIFGGSPKYSLLLVPWW